MKSLNRGFMGGVTLGIAIVVFATSFPAHAIDESPWSANRLDVQVYDRGEEPGCRPFSIEVASKTHNPTTGRYEEIIQACVMRAASYYLATSGDKVYIKLRGDGLFHYLRGGLDPTVRAYRNPKVTPATDRFVFNVPPFYTDERPGALAFYNDLPSSLLSQEVNDAGVTTAYSLNPSNLRYLTKIGVGLPVYHDVYSYALSENGMYGVAEVDHAGFIVIDFWSSRATVIARASDFQAGQGLSVSAVSDDGHFALVNHGLIIDMSGCGYGYGNDQFTREPTSPCTISHTVEDAIRTTIPGVASIYGERFVETFVLDISVKTNDENATPKRVVVRATAEPRQKLDYLALGDSFSSGEGDTALATLPRSYKQSDVLAWYATAPKWYREHTDQNGDLSAGIPEEKCHVSLRSYPYHLKSIMGLSDTQMQSVACSGAVVAKDYLVAPSVAYHGQKDHLKDLGDSKEGYLQTVALNEFIPGRVQQIKFVETYQPKVVTLTGGGNDVGFGTFLEPCLAQVEEPNPTCWYANSQEGRAYLGRSIQNQYSVLTQLYHDIKEASPGTELYVIGYPRFVSKAPDRKCGVNALLNDTELTFIAEGTAYLNSIIRAAAQHEGVRYIDIENSLEGHELCARSSSIAVNGMTLGVISQAATPSRTDKQESLHPNAYGQSLIALSIAGQTNGGNLLNQSSCGHPPYSYCLGRGDQPEPPAYFADAMRLYTSDPDYGQVQIRLWRDAAIDTAIYSTYFGIKTYISVFKSMSWVRVVIHSDPTDLGTYQVDSSGNLDIETLLPDSVKPGSHTLVIYGESPSGEPTVSVQVIEVPGADTDSHSGTFDPCTYITPIGEDTDHNGTDDACDPYLTPRATSSVSNGGDIVQGKAGKSSVSSEVEQVDQHAGETAQSGTSGLLPRVFTQIYDRLQLEMNRGNPWVWMAFGIATLGLAAMIILIIKKVRSHEKTINKKTI